jgi:ATP-dependent Clp protease ATP-binding subunit ClpX
LPVIGTLEPLSAETLVRILTEPTNALVRQYGKFFEMEDCALEFTEDALLAIAELAIERNTGARALRSITEGLMLDALYELPERKGSGKWVVDADVVAGRRDLFEAPAKPVKSRRRESA